MLVPVCSWAQRPSASDSDHLARRVSRDAVESRDNKGAGFAIVDKTRARLYLFDAMGQLQASSPVLLGLAHGDDSVKGIGTRPMAQIRPTERTTPAGRFVTEPGINTGGEDIVWIDYDAAVSMHRVRATKKSERRLERLASPSALDNRISYGCINVPADFYDAYVKPVFGNRSGVVYVLPENSPVAKYLSFARQEQ
jgi:hypothetical protein